MYLEALTKDLVLLRITFRYNSLFGVQICDKTSFESLKSTKVRNLSVSLKENQVNETHLSSIHFAYHTRENSWSLFYFWQEAVITFKFVKWAKRRGKHTPSGRYFHFSRVRVSKKFQLIYLYERKLEYHRQSKFNSISNLRSSREYTRLTLG